MRVLSSGSWFGRLLLNAALAKHWCLRRVLNAVLGSCSVCCVLVFGLCDVGVGLRLGGCLRDEAGRVEEALGRS